MKPIQPPIDPAKRTFVPPPPELSPRAARNIIRVFVGLLVTTLLFEAAAWVLPGKGNLAAAVVRSGTQWLLLKGLGEGNKNVHVGFEGWLFKQHDLDRVVGAHWQDRDLHGELVTLAAKLKQQETALVVVAIPERIALYPEQIRSGRYAGPVRTKDELPKLEALRQAGAEVLDMTEPLLAFGERTPIFFSSDSHWRPEAMKAVALAVKKHVQEKYPRLIKPETPIINATLLDRVDSGDLARALAPAWPSGMADQEAATLISIQGIDTDAKSPIVLHGGELMQAYDNPALTFGQGADLPRAGFATQFSVLLGRSVDVRGMPAPGEDYTDKKLVICVLPMAELVP